MIKKQLYAAPATEVLELRLEANVLQITSPTSPTLGNSGLEDSNEGDYVWQ